jgi:tRNA-binding protein
LWFIFNRKEHKEDTKFTKKNTLDKMITWVDFEKIEMRVGTILEVNDFPEARNPAYKLRIDLGEFGIKKSSAQITVLYKAENLVGQQVIAVVNFEPKKLANFMSECLVLGSVDKNQIVTLLNTTQKVENGLKVS